MTLAFAAALLTGLALRYWLATRQARHVAQHRTAVPTAFAERVPLAAHQRAADYTLAKSRVDLFEMAWSSGTLIVWTLLGGLNALNQALLAALGPGMGQQLALLAAFAAIGGLLDLPFSLYRTFVVEEQFGFNKTTWRLWLVDMAKGTVLGAAIGLPIAALILWLMGAAGSAWWLWAWCTWMGFNLLLLVIYPTLIAPWFNKFQPLEDQALAARVTALMQRCGFAAKGLFVMDGSRRSAHSNAFFTGFGASKRVVFFDTLLKQLSTAEMEAVLAHELGHFKHRHIFKMMATSFAMSLLGLAVLGFASQQIWFYTGLGVMPSLTSGNEAVALLLFMLVVPVFTFLLAPISSWRSRVQEYEADAYAVSQTPVADLSSALLKLYQDNASTLTPDPWYVKFYYSHPPASLRLAHMQHAQA